MMLAMMMMAVANDGGHRDARQYDDGAVAAGDDVLYLA
jgi:hypothetical protein